VAAFGGFFDVGDTTDHYAAAAGGKSRPDRIFTVNNAAGRKIRTLDVLYQVIQCRLGIVYLDDSRVNQLVEVMRRDVGGHTDGDTDLAVQ
jgi:hypothetical protein